MSRKNVLITAIRGILILALLVVIIFTQVNNPSSQTPIEEVKEATIANLDMSSLEEAPNRIFKRNYGLNANDYEGVVYYTGVNSLDVDEILIIRLADDAQSEELTTAINDRLETLKNSFENYGVDQYALLNASILDVQGNYLLYVVHPDAVIADQGFRDSL